MATVTRADLAAAVREEAGLRKRDAAELVDTLIEAICERLAAGEPVGISGFGSFSVRDKRERTRAQSQDRGGGADRGPAGGDLPGVRETEEARDGGDGPRGGRRIGEPGPAAPGRTGRTIIVPSFESAEGRRDCGRDSIGQDRRERVDRRAAAQAQRAEEVGRRRNRRARLRRVAGVAGRCRAQGGRERGADRGRAVAPGSRRARWRSRAAATASGAGAAASLSSLRGRRPSGAALAERGERDPASPLQRALFLGAREPEALAGSRASLHFGPARVPSHRRHCCGKAVSVSARSGTLERISTWSGRSLAKARQAATSASVS